MLATIWMCTHEWSLISSRTTALTFAECHHAFSCLSSLTRSTSARRFRFPRTGTLMRICSTASAGVRRVSRRASSGIGCSIRCSVSLSSVTTLPRLYAESSRLRGRPPPAGTSRCPGRADNGSGVAEVQLGLESEAAQLVQQVATEDRAHEHVGARADEPPGAAPAAVVPSARGDVLRSLPSGHERHRADVPAAWPQHPSCLDERPPPVRDVL